VLLPETDTEAAKLVAQRLKEQLFNQLVSTNQGEIKTKVEISMRTALQGNYQDFDELIAEVLEPFAQAEHSSNVVAVSNSQYK
jgi:PleD family two-component response regulator